MQGNADESFKLLEGNRDNFSKFSSTDTEELYQENVLKKPRDWYWNSRPVSYTLNSQRYRAPEWKDCDWRNSVLIFGCSFAYGVGVDDSQTISSYLQLKLNSPVINLGQSGTGITFAWANSIILRNYNINPKAVIYIWPQRNRQTEFTSPTSTIKHGIWNVENSWMRDLIINEAHNTVMAEYYIKSIRLMWSCPVIEASFHEDMSELTGCTKLDFLDFARDLKHPGNLTTAQVAFNLYNKIPASMR